MKNDDDRDDDTASETEEDCAHIARNLLEIRDTANWDRQAPQQPVELFNRERRADSHEVELPQQMSITKYYEPKFLEVFVTYNRIVSPGKRFDYSKHLMASCLEHLIPFSCWARENSARYSWLRSLLDDNVDLRPEVRNGLAMILVYGLSAARASTFPDTDMFTVLQDQETGLGIVNKTSLKIYNDPYSYFCFIKCCISGLIDAGRLPENERQNQPKKPKRQVENKEEVAAFLQIKSSLVTVLNRGDNVSAREKVQRILSIWLNRSKTVRNNRFSVALKFLQQVPKASPPASFLLSESEQAIVFNTTQQEEALAASASTATSLMPSFATSAHDLTQMYFPKSTIAGNGSTSLGNGGGIGDLPSISSLQGVLSATGSNVSGLSLDDLTQQRGFMLPQGAALGAGSLVNTPRGTVFVPAGDNFLSAFPGGVGSNVNILGGSMMSDFLKDTSVGQPWKMPRLGPYDVPLPLGCPSSVGALASLGPPSNVGIGSSTGSVNANSTIDGSIMAGATTESSSQFLLQQSPGNSQSPGITNSAKEATLGNLGSLESLSSGINANNQGVAAGKTLSRPLCAYRFERVGVHEWEFSECRIYDLEEFLNGCTSSVFFIDERKFSVDDRIKRSFVTSSTANGFVSLQAELQQRSALIASWPRSELPQLKGLVSGWDEQPSNLSLLDFWNSCSSNMGGSTNGARIEGTTSAGELVANVGGILAYEIITQVGLVVRACEEVGLGDDCWRFIYPNELLGSDYRDKSLGSFLVSIFPQIKIALAQVSDFAQVVVKYFPHKEAPQGIPRAPDRPPTMAYQTVGTLDENLTDVSCRLEASQAFYDFILQVPRKDAR